MMTIAQSATSLPKTAGIFNNRNFLLLFGGRIISQLGDQIYAFALSWYILELTKSSFQMAIFLVINMTVMAIIAPFGGIIADRLPRKRIMVWMDVIRGLIVLTAFLLLYQHLLQIWMLYISAIIIGFCGAVFVPAGGAIIPNIVEERQLAAATSASQFINSFCSVVGMLISGILYAWTGISTVFILNAVSFFISGFMEALLDLPPTKPNSAAKIISIGHELKRVFQELQGGCRYVKDNKTVYYLLLVNGIFNLVSFPIVMIYMPYIFNVVLKTTAFQLALPQASVWVGMIIGTLAAPKLIPKYPVKRLIFGGLSILTLISFITAPLLVPAIRIHINNWLMCGFWTVTNAIGGMAVSFFTIPMYVVFQKYIHDEYRGRFWGLEYSTRMLAICIGFLGGSFLAERVWFPFLFWGAAVGQMAIGLWAVKIKAIRELKTV